MRFDEDILAHEIPLFLSGKFWAGKKVNSRKFSYFVKSPESTRQGLIGDVLN
jgi:hypothetical protein